MRVLGVNGWPGVSHDAAACLIIDGEVVAFAEEERFTRHKHAYGAAPLNATAYCLAHAGITLDDVDVVAHGWDMPRLYRDRGLDWFSSERDALEHLLPPALFRRERNPKLTFVEHHVAHAASAYYLSGHDRGAILVLDGQGENESASLAVGVQGRIRILRSVRPGWSLGYFYSAVCEHVGLGSDAAGKMMGLASYGTPADATFGTFTFAEDGYTVDAVPEDLLARGSTDEESAALALWREHLASTQSQPANRVSTRYDPVAGRFRRVTARDPFDYRDLAATAQSTVEHCVTGMVRALLRETGETTLLLAGGVAFNATLNGKLLRMPEVGELFVQPLAGDQGVALGAAAWIAAEAGERVRPMSGSVAWGPEWSPGRIRDRLEAAAIPYTEPDDIAEATADLIADGSVIGWMQGAAEGGPRALGHRSILTRPTPLSQRDRVNVRVKDREAWRPFAPSLRAESAPELLGLSTPLPYMIVTTPVPETSRELMPAVVHEDLTTRPQTVSAEVDPLYHRLLGAVAGRTGVPVVLNTSFNGKEEPVVCSPDDALATFARCPLDGLALGPFLVQRDTGGRS